MPKILFVKYPGYYTKQAEIGYTYDKGWHYEYCSIDLINIYPSTFYLFTVLFFNNKLSNMLRERAK